MWKTLKTIATQSPWSNTRSLNKQHTNAAKQASWPTKKQLVTLRLSIWKYKCWLKSWKKLRGITVQFENKWSEENENGARKLGWVSILKGKNVIFVHLGCIKGGSPLSKFPECKAFIVFSNYLFILISRFLYLPLEVNSSRSWMVKWWIPRKTRYFLNLAALLYYLNIFVNSQMEVRRYWCIPMLPASHNQAFIRQNSWSAFQKYYTFSGIFNVNGRTTV